MTRPNDELSPLGVATIRPRVSGNDRRLRLFFHVKTWLQHIHRHFGNRREPWHVVFKPQSMIDRFYAIWDRIPGEVDDDRERYLEEFDDRCQKREPHAVYLHNAAVTLYEQAVPLLSKQIMAGFDLPQYVDCPQQTPDPEVLVICEPNPAVAVARRGAIRSCYFPDGSAGYRADLPVAQTRLMTKLFSHGRPRQDGRKWVDRNGNQICPQTAENLGWVRAASPRSRRSHSPRSRRR